jgi:hypothetical protein
MTIALGLLAVLALILANGYFVAAEFAFVAVRKGKLEEAAAASDGRGERERWRCCASCRSCCRAPQLGITATSLIVGCIAEPTLGRAFAPLLGAVGLGETAARGVTLTVGFVLATVGQMVLGELGPSNLALAEPERLRWPSTASLPSSSTTPSPASRTHNHPTGHHAPRPGRRKPPARFRRLDVRAREHRCGVEPRRRPCQPAAGGPQGDA